MYSDSKDIFIVLAIGVAWGLLLGAYFFKSDLFIGGELEKNIVDYEVKKEEIILTQKDKEIYSVYVDFDVYLLDKNDEILYKKRYNIKLNSIENKIINIEETVPDYIKSNEVKNVKLKIVGVYEYTFIKFIVPLIILICITFRLLYYSL